MKHEPPQFGLPVIYTPPFVPGQLRRIDVIEDMTLLEIVHAFDDLPPRFEERGTITINGHEIKRELWHVVRPKKPTGDKPVAVTLHYPPRGGGGGGGGTLKSVIGIVGAIALALVTYGIGSGFLFGTLGTLFSVGSFSLTGATLLAGAVGIAGALALSALTAPPTVGSGAPALGSSVDDTNTDSKESASATGNVLVPGGSIPRVVGTRKVFPPLAGYPFVELIDDDEYVEGVYVLNGPHKLENIRLENSSIDDVEDVEVETREGWEDDPPLTRFNRQGRMTTPQIEMSVHKVVATAQQQILTQSDPRKSCPVWHGVVSRNDPDEIWLHLLFPSGISYQAGTTQIGIPFRMRMRRLGTTDWINFPEFHVAAATIAQLRKAVLIKWKNDEPRQTVPASDGFVWAGTGIDLTSTDADLAHTDSFWTAHSHFTQSGSTWLYNGAETTANIRNVNLFANRVEFYIDPAVIPRGQYEIQIKRGSIYIRSSFTQSTYVYGGFFINFFTWWVSGGINLAAGDRTNISDRCGLTRVVSIWNEYPIQESGFAIIAVRARNRSIQNLSVIASGYVPDWDGSGWTNWTTTSNPAPHYRDALVGQLNLDPLPLTLLGDTELLAWRTLCDDNGWTCDAIVDDQRLQDHLQLLASCGYAKPYQSDIYAVTVDNDRSQETPQAIFSPMNSSNFRFEKAFARVPAGLIISYRNNEQDDDRAQTIVYQSESGFSQDPTLLESVTFDGLVTEASVRARAKFDLDQANKRSTFYYLDTDIEGLPVRRGDLVGVQYDVIDRDASTARIVTVLKAGGNVTGFVLDSEIPVVNEVDMLSLPDILAVPDMLKVGLTTGIAVRHYGNGVVTTHALTGVTQDTATITLATPIADDGTIKGFDDTNAQHGCLITSGRLGSEYLRLLVAAIIPTKDMKCTLMLVDEAPTLARFGALMAEDGVTVLTDESGIPLYAG